MAQKGLIVRAGKGLLDALMLLLRGTGALCAAFGSLFVAAASHCEPESKSDDSYMGEYDPMHPVGNPGREVSADEANEYGWKSW
jgi:hypothetical protein